MGQATPFKPIALIVEDEEMQRDMLSMLLEECEMGVVECDSGEAALRVLDAMGSCLSMMITDVNLAGGVNGMELARTAKQRFPELHVIVTSGASGPEGLPGGAKFMPKPWTPLDVLREAERVRL